VLAAGCAGTNGSATEQDIAQIRQDVNALRAAAQRGRGEADAIAQVERRSREQAAENARQITALSGRLEATSGELSRLSARLDELSRRMDTISREASPSPSSPRPPAPSVIVPPLTPGVGALAPTQPPSSPPLSARPAPPAPTRPPAGASGTNAAGNGTAEEAYQAANLDFGRGRYTLAINGFRDFLRRFPDAPQAESAQYGIGESYYSLASAANAEGQTDAATRALEQAVQEFRKVITLYPRGTKVPTALYKEALALTELKQNALAQTRLQYLLDHFPQSEEAPLARERLATLRK